MLTKLFEITRIFCESLQTRLQTCVLICFDVLSFKLLVHNLVRSRGLGVACWPLVPKFAGSNPAEAVGFLGRKNPQHAFLRRGSKAVGPCRRFAACKRSLNLGGSRNLGKITGHLSRPKFHLPLQGSLESLRTYRHLVSKVGTSKGGGKQWQTTPKNLSRMQYARATPAT